MKQAIMAALAAALLWAVLPLLTAAGTAVQVPPAQRVQAAETEAGTGTEEQQDTQAPAREDPAAEAPDGGFDAAFSLPVLTDRGVVSMDLRSYLTGVLLAEMPASFAPEAQKAQAVACRTYALRSYTHRRHDGAAVCTDSACCQGWTDPERAGAEARAAAEQAVRETDGLAIYYGGALIDATFFSYSGGQTEAAAAVWGSDLPYLQPVVSPGEEDAAHFRDRTAFSLDEFRAILAGADGAVEFPAERGAWVGSISYTPGGGVDTAVLGGRAFTGKQLRKLFSLRSTAFSLELTDDEAIFLTRGSGHRVGMSQYGANAMAKTGKRFDEILRWYYQGVEIRQADG